VTATGADAKEEEESERSGLSMADLRAEKRKGAKT
jgi:hypothetical protein